MRTFLFTLCLILLPLAQSIAADSKSQASSAQQINNIQVQLAVLDEKLKQQAKLGTDIKELESTQLNLKIQLSELQAQLVQQEKTQDKQLNGFNGRISDLAFYLAVYAAIISLLAVGLGFLVTSKAKSEAKAQANQTAEEHMQKWLEDNKDKLIAATKKDLKDISTEFNNRVVVLEEQAKSAIEKFEEEQEREWQKALNKNDQVVTSEHKENSRVTNSNYSDKSSLRAIDWFEKGIDAFGSQNFESAITAWDNVLAKLEDDDNPILRAITLQNKGISHIQLNQFDISITTFENLIEHFNVSDNEQIKVIIARAIIYRGFSLRKLNKFNDAIHAYDYLIKHFNDSDNEEIKVAVASAMIDRAFTLGKLNKFNDSIQAYDNLIQRFNDSDNKEIKKYVKNALSNLAEVNLLFEQPEEVLLRVTKAESYGLDPQMQAVMSFVRYLLDDINIETLFSYIKAIPAETEITWKFDEIRDYLNKVKFEKKEVTQAVSAFFEDHKDIQQLQNELGL